MAKVIPLHIETDDKSARDSKFGDLATKVLDIENPKRQLEMASQLVNEYPTNKMALRLRPDDDDMNAAVGYALYMKKE